MSVSNLRSLFRMSGLLNQGLKTMTTRHLSDDHPKPGVMPPPNEHLTFRPAMLDDLPVPQGDFYEDYKKRNRKYWRHLIQGVVFFSATVYYMCFVQEFIFFNTGPPPMPPKEERIKSFWVPPEDEDDDDD